MNEIKIGKLPTYYITGYTLNSISKLFQGGKIWWHFAQLYKNSTDCFWLEISSVIRFQNRIFYIANEEIGAATVDSR